MKVRLTRKFSNLLNGIDLSQVRTGDTLELATRDAQMLVAEGWAEPVEFASRDQASDRTRTRTSRNKSRKSTSR